MRRRPTQVPRRADPAVRRFADGIGDDDLKTLVTDLGGHDLGLLVDTFRSCDAEVDRPSVVFAYTIKGHGLPMAGDPMNHAALLSPEQIDDVPSDGRPRPRHRVGPVRPRQPTPAACAEASVATSTIRPLPPRPTLPIPPSARSVVTTGSTSTQEAFGRVLASLADVAGVGERIVTTAPDVSISTNLGGFINKRGVYSHVDTRRPRRRRSAPEVGTGSRPGSTSNSASAR